jgi:hypothetical protein
VKKSPEVVFFGVYPGFDFLAHTGAIRFFVSQEAVIPDFNLADYGFGFAHLTFGDRYLRVPNYALHSEYWVPDPGPLVPFAERRFCNFVYSHGGGDPARKALFDALSTVAPVDASGKYLNNMPLLGTNANGPGWRADKLAFLRRYKFTIACENARVPGYTTEKLSDAIAAGTIPIYWGDPEVARAFNPSRIIVVESLAELPSVIARVRHLNDDQDSFLEVVNQPTTTDAQLEAAPSPDRILDFVEHAISSGRQIDERYMWGREYAARAKRMALADRRWQMMARPVVKTRRAFWRVKRWSMSHGSD